MSKQMKKPIAFVLSLVMAFGMWTGLPAMIIGLEVGAPAEVYAAKPDTIDSLTELEDFINGGYDSVGSETSHGSITTGLDGDGNTYTKIYTISTGAIVTLGGVLEVGVGNTIKVRPVVCAMKATCPLVAALL